MSGIILLFVGKYSEQAGRLGQGFLLLLLGGHSCGANETCFLLFFPFGDREAEAEESADDRVYIVLYPQLLMEKTFRIPY
jgi:hypothetical protein